MSKVFSFISICGFQIFHSEPYLCHQSKNKNKNLNLILQKEERKISYPPQMHLCQALHEGIDVYFIIESSLHSHFADDNIIRAWHSEMTWLKSIQLVNGRINYIC